ncbi:MAG TPA: GAF and ANTAR domain-containing protein [Arthrobacter sp.]|jgi:GAF domain-containing protein|uniref:GAF and ANTAR domain-containing protein n=1 Tax=Arthrobacter sp. RT-1 TaxID=2292263 RepID=UPI000E1F1EF9|nr:GAF and ANTAR domain-containing protein [Arthrobacter sp. RT-1]RDV12426.1 ANTAR domain-containing protein [Arthrobacter sp. RT-1]
MAGSDALTTSDEYQDLLLESAEFSDFLLGLATMSATLLGADTRTVFCTITVERNGAPSTVSSSSDLGRRLDERQYAADAGPCLTAVRQQSAVLVEDMATDQRWGKYAQAALSEGVQAMLAVPIRTDGSSRAALNCYARKAHAFDEETVSLLETHAASMSRILRLALRLHAPQAYPEHLRSALKSRAVVDAAIALIMLQHRGGRDGALELLQLAAVSSNRRIQQIATDIVDGGSFSAARLDGG